MTKYLKILFKVCFSIAFFSVLLSFVKGNELLGVFKQVDPVYMALSFMVTFIMLLASCAKWKVVLDLKDRKISFFELLKIYMVGYFFSNILPSTVGGDVVRSYYAGRLIENQAYSAVSVFVERFSGILFLFALVIIAPLAQPQLYQSPYIFFPACAGLFFLAVTLWVWLSKNPFALPNLIAGKVFSGLKTITAKTGSSFFIGLAAKCEKLFQNILAKLQKFRTELQIAMKAAKHDKQFLFRIIYLTIFFYILTWVNVYTAFRAFGVEVDFLQICAIVPAIMLVAHVPVTLLGNLGYFESVFVFYFLLVGVSGAESLAMGLLLRLKTLVMGIIGFGVYLLYKQTNMLDLQEIESKTDTVEGVK
ncbi:lysylphosphatidylglycerol synthase transmembrane domain-containing protein [Desulforhopalus sp. IMCC35007]|uniref:lysylphosphatidylglycerol synthase transmembrane domain-containing protein n=1 Tax=Desulforhopalus sp. IMCC35007 TaxID=2569543 RepID=UPI0010AE22BE|nr:lysylphosphatidylglycerol synthase transmembrane domain-containing protein [Desulforhopalus sp. IMCC35007]TKB09330.1 flippase-like domain-containing protein [Desulforhopalus sp. IMCC35007]